MNIYNKRKLETHYCNIYKQNKSKLLQGGVGDVFLVSPETDARMSLALLIRIDESISEKIYEFLEKIKAVEPDLYFYPKEDFHITVMDILKGIPNRVIPDNIEAYIQCIKECTDTIEPFYIEFRGVTASDNAVLVKGYYEYGLEKLRRLLRKNFTKKHLLLEERYETFSSHITVVRIPDKLTHSNKFITCIQSDDNFGTMKVGSIELVFHNWYDSRKTVLSRFNLSTNL